MSKNICIIQGHPHNDPAHFCHALADAYEQGAHSADHFVHNLNLAAMDIPYLRDPADFAKPPPNQILDAQAMILNADHMVIIYPLWLGTMPALVKAFFEQLSRNEFAIAENKDGLWPKKMMKGKSARVVVTMAMPSAAYKIFFGAHGVKSFEKSILGMAGFKPIRETLIGGVVELGAKQSAQHLEKMRSCGEHGD